MAKRPRPSGQGDPDGFSVCPHCGAKIPQRPIADAELRKSVGDSYQIYQGSMTLCTILMAFVFTALTLVLADSKPLDADRRILVWLLVSTMLLLLIGVTCFHFTANQCIRYWQSFWPDSTLRNIGGLSFGLGISLLLAALAWMLRSKDMGCLAFIVAQAAVTQIVIVLWKGRLHKKGAPYIRRVDGMHSADL